MTSKQIKEMDSKCVMQTYGRFDVAIDHGAGATLYSPEGDEYIDFTSGIGVNCLGYGNKKWVSAITEQAMKFGHISNLFYSEPYVKLAEALTSKTGMSNVFFANSGAESNEGMIKCARKYSFDKYGEGRNTVITLVQSFHGRTVTTLAATGQDVFHNYFFPFTEGFRYAKANDFDDLMDKMGNDVCAVMIELIQGEGGVLPLNIEYVQAVAEYCAKNDVLLLVDEVQTGVGRTGSLFAFQQFGIKPDIVSFAKGIAGGLPMGGIMAGEKTKNVLGAGTHATTFGGNPIAASAACCVLDTLDDAMMDEIKAKGEYIRSTVSGWDLPCVGEVRGMGLMVGISIKGTAPKEAVAMMVKNGLLALTAGKDAIRLLPPLVITYEEIDKGLSIMKSVLEKLA